ncbi:MAG: type II secretion system F family protein [Firmicutes bacterium]|nr:type II secretion system F family protein [Bacillota bacterium]
MGVLIVVVFAASLWVAYLVVGRLLAPRVAVAERLEALRGRSRQPAPAEGRWSDLPAADRLMGRLSVAPRLEQLLDQADLPMKPFELVLLAAVSGLACALAGMGLRRDPALSLALGLAGLTLPILWVHLRRLRRRDAFNRQLPDALQTMSNTMRAGYGFSQGMQVVATDLPAPISVEFARGLREMNLGLTVEEVLQNMARRMQSADFDLAVSGILINRQVGGNLAELLDQISATIRERVKLQNFIRVLTAEQRLSAIVVMGVPPLLAVILLIAWREYMSYLLFTRVGQAMLGLAALMQAAGIYVIRRIVAIEV